MRLPRRRAEAADAPPPEVLAVAGLRRGERVLAAAHGDDGTWLLGTRARLVVVEAGEPAALGWEAIEDAGWNQDDALLRVREAGEYGHARRTWAVPFGEDDVPGAFLQLLRERVTASIVVQRRAEVRGRRGVVAACRRNPTGGSLRWTVAFDPGLEPEDADVRAAAEQLLARLRAELGELADT